MTLDDFVDRWKAAQVARNPIRTFDGLHLVTNHLGGHTLRLIGPGTVFLWLATLRDNGVDRADMRTAAALLHEILTAAVDDGAATRNAAARVEVSA
ncbi:hypothetical protein ACWEQ4_01565 [Rhodococcus sp. NPDC003994]